MGRLQKCLHIVALYFSGKKRELALECGALTLDEEFVGLPNSSRGLRLLRIRHSFKRTKSKY